MKEHLPKKCEILCNSCISKNRRGGWQVFIIRFMIRVIIRAGNISFFGNLFVSPKVGHKNVNHEDEFPKTNICIVEKSIFSDRYFFLAFLAVKKMITAIGMNSCKKFIAGVTVHGGWKNIVILK